MSNNSNVDYNMKEKREQNKELQSLWRMEGISKDREYIIKFQKEYSRQMFEHECVDEDYATRVYPCLGRTENWIGACEKVRKKI